MKKTAGFVAPIFSVLVLVALVGVSIFAVQQKTSLFNFASDRLRIPTRNLIHRVPPKPTPSPTPIPKRGSPKSVRSSLTKNVQLLIYNPTLQNGQTLVNYKGWNNPDTLTNQLISDFHTVSGGFVNYQVVDRIVLNNFPPKSDGFQYTESTYLSCLNNSSSCHQPDLANYYQFLYDGQSCEKLNAGQIDELWVWGGPYFGYYESRLAGPNSFWYNSPPMGWTTCNKLLPIMGYNYERGIGEAMESYGHRTESVMRQVYGGWDSKNGTTPWDIFTRRDIDVPGQARCGNIHFAPASQSDYDWGNPRTVKSACDDYFSYPNLPASPNFKDTQCAIWNCDGYLFKKWWFSHLPKDDSWTNGKWNNWWRYIIDYENTISTPPPTPTPTPFPPHSLCIDNTQCNPGEQCTQDCPPPVIQYQPGAPTPTPLPFHCLTATESASRQKFGCPICLSEKTMIYTPKGQISVKDLKLGNLVYSLNQSGEKIIVPILKLSRVPVINHHVYSLTLSDGRQLQVSPYHPLTNYQPIQTLKVGDAYDQAKVIKIDLIPYTDQATYDLLPDSLTGIYWANGIPMGSTLKNSPLSTSLN